MGLKRVVTVAMVLVGAYLAIAFGKPYYQYLMMYQAFTDAVDAGIARIQVVKTHAGADVSEEVLQAVQEFLQKRAIELGLPPDSQMVEVQMRAGHVLVKVVWVAQVRLLTRPIPLNFSLQQDRKLP